MSAAELYDATLIKRRRATRAEMEERAEFLNGYAEERELGDGPLALLSG